MADLGTQALTVTSGVAGGIAGYFLGGKSVLWTGVGALVAAVAVPPLIGVASEALAASGSSPKTVALIPGETIIERAKVGDEFLIEAPPGWGVPSAGANIPGFLEVESTDVNDETTTIKVVAGGQGQIQMTSGKETATLSIMA